MCLPSDSNPPLLPSFPSQDANKPNAKWQLGLEMKHVVVNSVKVIDPHGG